MNSKISFIVPAHNCGKSIERALLSVIALDLPSYEIVVIDDGSTDNTNDIVSQIAAKNFEVVRLYSIQNSGVSHARNVGIEQATGDWVIFVDADDTVEKEFANSLANLAVSDDEEIIRYSYVLDNGNETTEHRFVEEERRYNRQTISAIVEQMLGLQAPGGDIRYPASFGCVWGTAYPLRLLRSHNLRFHESLSMMEDLVFLLEAISFCKSLRVSPLLSYRYFDFGSGASRSWSDAFERSLSQLPGAVSSVLNRFECDKDGLISSFCLTVASTLVHNRINYSSTPLFYNVQALKSDSVLRQIMILVENGYRSCSGRLGIRKRIQHFLIKNKLFSIIALYYRLSQV